MAFFKHPSRAASNRLIQRIERLTWVLIYTGLLALILGWWVLPADDDTGYVLLAGGGLVAVVGVILIFVRSKIKADS